MIWRSVLSVAFLLMGVTAFLEGASSAPLAETEAQLQASMQMEHNPVKKSIKQTRLARIKLQQAIDAYDQGKLQQGGQLVSTYLSGIKDSWQMLRSSGRNAVRAPRGFKELDIELREDARLLDDLKRRTSYFERDPLEKAEKEVEQVRVEVLQALFPAARSPQAAKPPARTH
jgi:hypothetical protein